MAGSRAAGGRARPPRTTARRFRTAVVTAVLALVAMGLSSALGNPHSAAIHERVFAFAGAFAFLLLAVVAVRSTADTLATTVGVHAGRSGGLAIKIVASFVGYIIVLFVVLGLLAVPVQHLLLGGAFTGVIVGIAAQQALGNVFAGLVLLLAQPFGVHERVRIRSGSLGGVMEGVVRSMSLTYTTIETTEGPVNVPNSALLAAAIGPAPDAGQSGPPEAGSPLESDPQSQPRVDAAVGGSRRVVARLWRRNRELDSPA